MPLKLSIKNGHSHHWLIIGIGFVAVAAIAVGTWWLWLSPRLQDKPVPVASVPPSKQQTVEPQPRSREPSTTPDYKLPPIKDGMVPVLTSIPTTQKVVFLGIDDGAYKDTSVVDLMKKHNIKASLFLSKLFIASNPTFFKQLTALGSLVEDHTLSHNVTMSRTMSYAQQKAEICGMADYEQAQYGRRPLLFRPPGGDYSNTMRKAAADCGMKAIITWIAKANGGAMQYQIGNKLRPGDIVLMHFRPEFEKDMAAFVAAQNAAGLHTELLEDWLI